jgi:hypothetical protein
MKSHNHIDTVREHLLDQMQALRTAKDAKALELELERAKGISALAQVACNTAKVEVDYLTATKQTSAPFLEAPPDRPYRTPPEQPVVPNGISTITRHRLKG